jgi:RES domain-containing protein
VVLWRVSNYSNLDGAGGIYVSGRWHTKGRPVIYCTLNPATALLETLVHMEIDAEDRPEHFQVIKVEGPDSLSREIAEEPSLPPDWANEAGATQAYGNRWLAERRSVLLQVPSVLVPETWNVLVNPRHEEANLLQITTTYQHILDRRLF